MCAASGHYFSQLPPKGFPQVLVGTTTTFNSAHEIMQMHTSQRGRVSWSFSHYLRQKYFQKGAAGEEKGENI